MASSPLGIAKEAVTGSIVISVLMIVAGVAAIFIPPAAGIAVAVFVAWLLIFSGAAHLAFGWHTRSAGGFLWELLLAIAYGGTGVYILLHPVAGLEALTLALAIYLAAEALLEFVLFLVLRRIGSSAWLLFDGIITLILAVLVFKSWPSSSLWVIGTLVGISMLFAGVSRLALSMAARRLVSKLA
jgi:uncharacterized membrane protein HdeD (DUF308 family)